MKKCLLTMLAFATLLLSPSCSEEYDDSDLVDRIEAIEDWISELESDVATLQSLVLALESNVYVTSVNTLSDGYEIVFSNGQTVAISDGISTAVAFEEIDGVYYWTLNGELMTDGSGNYIQASAEIPYIQDGNWWVGSTDTGVQAQGASGEDGDDAVIWSIGDDGYWYADGEKTDNIAIGEDGSTGSTGSSATSWTIGTDGYWYKNGVKTTYKAVGTDGVSASSPISVTINSDGTVTITIASTGATITLPMDSGLEIISGLYESTNGTYSIPTNVISQPVVFSLPIAEDYISAIQVTITGNGTSDTEMLTRGEDSSWDVTEPVIVDEGKNFQVSLKKEAEETEPIILKAVVINTSGEEFAKSFVIKVSSEITLIPLDADETAEDSLTIKVMELLGIEDPENLTDSDKELLAAVTAITLADTTSEYEFSALDLTLISYMSITDLTVNGLNSDLITACKSTLENITFTDGADFTALGEITDMKEALEEIQKILKSSTKDNLKTILSLIEYLKCSSTPDAYRSAAVTRSSSSDVVTRASSSDTVSDLTVSTYAYAAYVHYKNYTSLGGYGGSDETFVELTESELKDYVIYYIGTTSASASYLFGAFISAGLQYYYNQSSASEQETFVADMVTWLVAKQVSVREDNNWLEDIVDSATESTANAALKALVLTDALTEALAENVYDYYIALDGTDYASFKNIGYNSETETYDNDALRPYIQDYIATTISASTYTAADSDTQIYFEDAIIVYLRDIQLNGLSEDQSYLDYLQDLADAAAATAQAANNAALTAYSSTAASTIYDDYVAIDGNNDSTFKLLTDDELNVLIQAYYASSTALNALYSLADSDTQAAFDSALLNALQNIQNDVELSYTDILLESALSVLGVDTNTYYIIQSAITLMNGGELSATETITLLTSLLEVDTEELKSILDLLNTAGLVSDTDYETIIGLLEVVDVIQGYTGQIESFISTFEETLGVDLTPLSDALLDTSAVLLEEFFDDLYAAIIETAQESGTDTTAYVEAIVEVLLNADLSDEANAQLKALAEVLIDTFIDVAEAGTEYVAAYLQAQIEEIFTDLINGDTSSLEDAYSSITSVVEDAISLFSSISSDDISEMIELLESLSSYVSTKGGAPVVVSDFAGFAGYEKLVSVSNLPETLKVIGNSAFANTAIASIELPASVEIIGSLAFENCPLKSITCNSEKAPILIPTLKIQEFVVPFFTEEVTLVLPTEFVVDAFKGVSGATLYVPAQSEGYKALEIALSFNLGSTCGGYDTSSFIESVLGELPSSYTIDTQWSKIFSDISNITDERK